MFRGKLVLLLLFSFTVLSESISAAPASPVEKKSSVTQKKKKGTVSTLGVGVGYLMFSESMKVTTSTQIETGVANYAGLSIYLDQSWTKGRWIYGGAAGIASGKATGGGLSSITYQDSGKRSWTFIYFEGFGLYRVASTISVGAGFIGGSRSADWKSSTDPITVKGVNKVIYAPEFLMRWSLSRRLTLIQSLSTPDFRGGTMWRWTTHYNL